MIYPIEPVAKPRQTRSDKWKQRPCVMRYRAFADKCRLYNVELPVSGATVIFYLPMPKSWSKKKKAKYYLKPHQQKPDLDNLLKALGDAIYKDDSKIWGLSGLYKIWEYKGMIEICTSLKLIKTMSVS